MRSENFPPGVGDEQDAAARAEHVSQRPPRLASGLFYRSGKLIAGLIYRVCPFGLEHLPKTGGALICPNHITWVDAVVLQLASPRPIRFLVFEGIYKIPWLNPIFRLVGAIPIHPRKARSAIEGAAEGARRGELVCIFPEGELTRTGVLLRLKRGFEIIAREAGVPVIPVFLDQLWGSIFSFEKKRYFTKWPKRIPYRVTVAFGEPILPKEATTALLRERLLDLGEFCFQRRPILQRHLAPSCVYGLKKGFDKTALIDGMDGSILTRGKLLAAAIALSRHLKKNHKEKRLGIVLPPGKGAFVANLAVLFAGKIPVNLNFTAGTQAISSSIRRGGVQTVLTAKAFVAKLPNFPWPGEVVHIDKLLPKLKTDIVRWFLVARLMPSPLLCGLLGLQKRGGREEAVLLFTSGSSGEPKGVVLSHKNVLGNVAQFGQMLDLDSSDILLASLPLFHSFGCTVCLWYPIIEGLRVVTFPNPLDVSKNAELIEKHKVTLLLATPGFLRGYLKRAKPEQLRTLKLTITGAEKLPRELATEFENKFGKTIHEGYGLTETSPVASVNLPDPLRHSPEDSVQEANRPGSVGRILPGMTARIKDPETGRALSLHETGLLFLKGPNIFEEYLDDPARTAEVLDNEGWFMTGDLARFDEDGFLFIEGRLSRFSKIAGEMVPHETVEAAIVKAFGNHNDETRSFAIVSVPEETKGEALVLLTTLEVDRETLRIKLSEAGLPNLWIPRLIKKIDRIPLLGSGKLDLSACKREAENALKGL